MKNLKYEEFKQQLFSSTEFLAECSDDQPYCLDEMMIDWTGKGQQITYLRRSCAAEPANGACTGDDNTKFKV